MCFFKKIFIMTTLSLLLLNICVFAQSEDELDKEFLSNDVSGDVKSEKPKAEWDNFGFIESVNHFPLPTKSNTSDYEPVKLELRGRLNVQYGTENIYGKFSGDAYFDFWQLKQSDASKMGRVDLQELYLGGGYKFFQFKLGKQLFSWGTGDVLQPTNYFDQLDMRQFFAIDKDDRYRGVWSLSLKFLIKDFAIETVVTPVHSPTLLPGDDSFWGMDVSDKFGSLSADLDVDSRSTLSLEKTSFAVRGGGTAGPVDFHVSYFNGIASTVIMKPELGGTAIYVSGWPVDPIVDPSNTYIGLKSYYDRVNSVGFDFAFSIWKLSFRAEACITPDMYAVVEPDQADVTDEITAILVSNMPMADGTTFSTRSDFVDIDIVPYMSYVIGADINYYGSNGFILVEWMHSVYLKNKSKYIEPMMTEILIMRINDKFFDERFIVEAGVSLRPVQKIPGFALTYELGWDFKNGLTIATGGMFFFGNDDDLFEMLDDKDMLYLEARYEF